MDSKDISIIGKFIEQIKKIKENKAIELVFRSPSTIKGINEFIKHIKSRNITEAELTSFFDGKDEIKKDGKLENFVKSFINDKSILDKTAKGLYKFWYENEKPSLFNNDSFIEKENNIYVDFIASNPDKFDNMTTFDKLTKMRHYEVPNRLLDVTFDPLLALYFSLGEKKDGSKIVFIYPIKETNENKIENKEIKNIKNFDSDTITVLSIMSRLDITEKKILDYIVCLFKDILKEHTKNKKYSFSSLLECKKYYNCKEDYIELIKKEKEEIDINKEIEKYLSKINKGKYLSKINKGKQEKKSLLSVYYIIENDTKDDLFIEYLKKRHNSDVGITKTDIEKIKNINLDVLDVLKKKKKLYLSQIEDGAFFKEVLSVILNKIEINAEEIDAFLNFSEKNLTEKEKVKIEDIKNKIEILKTSRYFTIKELFNFFVSIYVSELTWQLKKEIPSWYENVLSLNTFTQCYLVKPKMNNPRIVAQSGAFIIYPFKSTEIKGILEISDEKSIKENLIFEIDNPEELKSELGLLNIKETKYMPDDLKKYAKEIKENHKNKKNV